MLYRTTVAPNTLGLLKDLMQKPYLQDFRLVGGTSLSLQIGHRISVDLDMFCNEPFDSGELKSIFDKKITWAKVKKTIIKEIQKL